MCADNIIIIIIIIEKYQRFYNNSLSPSVFHIPQYSDRVSVPIVYIGT